MKKSKYGLVGIIGIGALIYYLLSKKKSSNNDNEPPSPELKDVFVIGDLSASVTGEGLIFGRYWQIDFQSVISNIGNKAGSHLITWWISVGGVGEQSQLVTLQPGETYTLSRTYFGDFRLVPQVVIALRGDWAELGTIGAYSDIIVNENGVVG